MVKDPEIRPEPLAMLEEPWMKEIAKKKINMQQFLKTVWDWKD
jgi:mitogen-activated protein kinase kinase